MNHYDEDKSAITAALMGLSCEGDCGPLGILMHCAVLTLVFCAATIAITLLGLFCFPYTLSIGSGLGHVKADLKKFCRTKK